MPCERAAGRRFGVHLELFADRHVVLIPAGIGIARPRRRSGPYVRSGSCYGPAITREPTGVIELKGSVSLRELFALWGQPLGTRRLAAFHGSVAVFVNGVCQRGPPGALLLGRHSEIVLEVGSFVAPHSSYRFPPGL